MMTHSINVSALFLDIGGVLLTNGWDRNARHLAAKTFDLDFAEMDERHHLTFDTYEVGKLSLEEYLTRTIFYQPRSFTRDAFRDFMFAQSQPFPEMIALVRGLKQQYGLKTAVISNEGRELTEYRIAKFGLGEFIDFFVSSCFVHFRKPDEDIFRIAVDIAQVKAEHGLYIEDRALFVEEAREVGLKGIKHDGVESTRRELEKYGLVLG
jgi:putative hydrolase of the HAD superfamily